MVNKIDLFSGLYMNPIPLEFEQALTTTEWLGALQAKVNELVDTVNKSIKKTNDYTDEQISNLRKVIDDNYGVLNNFINEVKAECTSYTDTQIKALTLLLKNYIDEITKKIAELTAKDSAMQKEINELRDMFRSGDIFIVNPSTGETENVQYVINELYELINAGASGDYFTASMYEDLELTATQYEVLQVVARAYDNNWKTIFYNE